MDAAVYEFDDALDLFLAFDRRINNFLFCSKVRQVIDFIERIIKIKTSSSSSFYTKTLMQGHGAMMTGSNGNSMLIQYLCNVMGMAVNETHQPSFFLRGGAEDFDARYGSRELRARSLADDRAGGWHPCRWR